MSKGYDEGYEDRLFEQIEWPVDGYQLFDIGHFIGGRDWFDGQWESNCVFVPRSLLDQVGAMDHDFNAPGRRLRQPRLLRAHDDLSAHQARDDARRGLVPSGPRRDHDERAGARPSAGTCSTPTATSTPRFAGRVFKAPPKMVHYVGALPGRRAAHEGAADGRARCTSSSRTSRGPTGARRSPSRCRRSCARSSSTPSGAARSGSRRPGWEGGPAGRPPT